MARGAARIFARAYRRRPNLSLPAARPRVAFVVQRCAADVFGGAERLAFQTAQHMREHWDVEVLTTCARSVETWENALPPGLHHEGGVAIRRFPVDRPRATEEFEALGREVAERLPNDPALERRWMQAQGPAVPSLSAHVAAERERFTAFFFYTYLYGTTYFVLPEVAERAVLFPLAHDEWPLRLGIWDAFFRLPRRVVTVSLEERRLLERRFGDGLALGPTIPTGIERPPGADGAAFRERHAAGRPYLLYLGRVDRAKDCDLLFADYLTLPRAQREALPLVLVGPVTMELPDDPTILALGSVDETAKWSALEGCEMLVAPSQYESMSYVVLEAWAAGRPVIVTGRSAVLIGLVERAGGGVWYSNAAEFAGLVGSRLFRDGARLGRNGQAYVAAEHAWPAVVERHRRLLAELDT